MVDETHVEWELPTNFEARKELYRCFTNALQMEDEKLMVAIGKQIRDTLKKTGRLPNINEYKDLDKLIAIREEYVKYLTKVYQYSENVEKMYSTPAEEIHIQITRFCILILNVFKRSKTEELTKVYKMS